MPHNIFTRSTSVSHVAGIMLLGLALIAPMMWVLGYSLLYSLGIIGMFAEGATLQHWRVAFATGGLSQSLIYTPVVAATSTLPGGISPSLTAAFKSRIRTSPRTRTQRRPASTMISSTKTTIPVRLR